MRLGPFTRENGPACIILLMVLMVSAATLTGGIVRYLEEGLTDNSLILILFGAIVFIFVVLGFVITLCTDTPQRQPSTQAYPDDPPKYRETWRREHLESISQSQATDTYTGDPALETRGSTGTNFSRLDVRSLWKSVVIPGVHDSARRGTTVSMTNMSHAEAGISSRPGRANTHPCVYVYDDGLPTYEEAVLR